MIRWMLKGLTAIATAFFLFSLWGMAMAADNPHAKRSKALLPSTLEIDRSVADALARKSLPGLQTNYARLQEATEEGEKLVANGGMACACDVAHSNLLIVVGFAINKLDKEGRYQDWMEDDSLGNLANYRELVAACGEDASSRAFSSITDEMIKHL